MQVAKSHMPFILKLQAVKIIHHQANLNELNYLNFTFTFSSKALHKINLLLFLAMQSIRDQMLIYTISLMMRKPYLTITCASQNPPAHQAHQS